MAEDTPSHPTEQSIDPSLHPLRDALRDRYILEAEIGVGGMGTVLRARDLKHSRTVAIKVLRSDMARSIGADRFHREIQTAARLMHPNIITVFDSGSAAGMLYFVMPYVAGESLRDRLNREGRLPVDDAVRIASQLAGALRYAHDAGVVHRDIKPENILLSDGHAWLVDFGVAQAAASSRDTRLTTTGLIVGSPQYVSPEQAKGEGEVDGRADLYSLGCVLYEMLAGRAPFEGRTLEATLLGHMTQPPPALPSHVPPYLAQVVTIVLAKKPDERFQNAGELEKALGGQLPTPRRYRRRASRPAMYGMAVILIAIPVVLLGQKWLSTRDIAANDAPVNQFDTTRYAVLEIDADTSLQASRIAQLLTDALGEWTDIDVVDQSRIGAVESLNVGRAITGSVSSYGDSVRIYLELADRNRPGTTLAKARGTAISRAAVGASLKNLIAQLLTTGVSPECVREHIGTRVLAVVYQCDIAFSAIQDGTFERADSALTRALQADPAYARGALWLALVRSWMAESHPDTRALISIARGRPEILTRSEAALVEAEELLQAQRFPEACTRYGAIVGEDSLQFAAWLRLADCLRHDNAVVEDKSSSSGYAFRTSYQRAVDAYRRAFEIKPSLMAGFRERSFARVRDLLLTSTTSLRLGVNARTGAQFAAYPSWSMDTIALIPIPRTGFEQVGSNAWPTTLATAVDHQRDILRSLAVQWARQSPSNPVAREALAVAQELVGDHSAIGTLSSAQALVVDPSQKSRLAAREILLRVKFGLPHNTQELRTARQKAERLLTEYSESGIGNPADLVAIAMLIGRPSLAAELARSAAEQLAKRRNLPTGVVKPARAFLVFAAAGGPADSVRRLESETLTAIGNAIAPENQSRVRDELLARGAAMCFEFFPVTVLSQLQAGAITRAQLALLNRDSTAAERFLSEADANRRNARPADLTPDIIYAEASLLKQLNRPHQAAQRLGPVLDAIGWYPPGRIEDFVHLAAVLRGISLRSRIAAELGNPQTAALWAGALTTLWSDAEPEQTGVVKQLKRIAASN